MTALPTTRSFDRTRLPRLADGLLMATAMLLPWSTSATSVLIVLWLLALLPTLEVAAARREVLSYAGGLPVLLWLLAVAGLAWADAPFKERMGGLESFHRLLVIPLLLAQIRNSTRGAMVAFGFLVSEVVLLTTSLVHAALWDIVPWHIGPFAGVPVKNYISQSEFFEACGFVLLGFVVDAWRKGHRRQAFWLLLLAATFLFDILYVATGRTALVALPVLAVLFGFRHFGPKGVLGALAACILLAAITWASSPYLRWRVSHAVEEVKVYVTTRMPTSSGARLEFWRKSVGFIITAPILGHGTGSINGLYRQSQTDDGTAASLPAENPHQQIFAVAIQLGLVGTALLIAMWIAHLALFCRPGLAAWAGLVVVVQHLVSSLFNSHLFDFTEGWLYVLGVGVLGGLVLRAGSPQPQAAVDDAARSKPDGSRLMGNV